MPKPRIKIRSNHLVKYTFPVVRAALEKVGPPREIGKVPPPQAGPLLVTLAMDIASDCWRDICLHLEANSGGGPASAGCPVPDLLEGAPVHSDGAGQLLLRTNARWWIQFSMIAEMKFHNLAQSTGPLRLILRSAMARTAAEGIGKNKITYDASWLEVVQNPTAHFALRLPEISGLRTINEAAIRKWRSILLKEDASQRKWIQSLAGSCHPYTSSYWDDSSRPHDDYRGWRPRNELYYCLAQGLAGWTPWFSDSFADSEWQAWLDVAASNTPPYWCPL
jgi:hypothetical protein